LGWLTPRSIFKVAIGVFTLYGLLSFALYYWDINFEPATSEINLPRAIGIVAYWAMEGVVVPLLIGVTLFVTVPLTVYRYYILKRNAPR